MKLYRPEIDGLRAIAVLAVVLTHMNPAWLPGGFVGVDVFFVISGFLITGIIYRQITSNTFSIRDFYIRRLRRILPVYFLVVAITLLAGYVLLIPADLAALLDSIRYSIFFAVNIYFSREKGYFDISSEEKPLLHLWSLSVEEQFYVIWPILLLMLWGLSLWFSARISRTNTAAISHPTELQHKLLLASVGVITIALLVVSHYMVSTESHSVQAYYLLQARGVELIIGAITRLIPFRRLRYAPIWAGLGLVMLVASFFLLNQHSVFPGFNALLPCVGAAIILYATDGQGTATIGSTKWLLSRPSIVWMGLLSYSIYLWHWPILAYMRYVYGQNTLPGTWLLIAGATMLVLSFLSYKIVEQPFRKIPFSFPSAVLVNYMVPGMLIISVSTALQKVYIPYSQPDAILTSYGSDVCHGNFTAQCQRGDRTVPPTLLVVGDSHAAHYNTFIDTVGKAERWSASVFTASSCSPVFDYDHTVLAGWAQEPCVSLKSYFRSNYKKFDGVLFASSWAYQLGLLTDISGGAPKDYDAGYLDKLKATLKEISKVTPVYVLSDVPLLTRNPFRLRQLEKWGINLSGNVDERYLQANKTIQTVANSISNVYWLDTGNFFSALDSPGIFEGETLYFDTHHLNIYGGQKLAEWFLSQGLSVREK